MINDEQNEKILPINILHTIHAKLDNLPFDISKHSLRQQYLNYIKGVIETKSDEWLSQNFIPVVEKGEPTRLV